MKVLLVTQLFWPEGADYKNHVLAAELAARGHEVIVVTTFPNYPLGRIYEGYQQSWRQWESRHGYHILRVPSYPDHSTSGLRRALNYLSFTLSAATIGFLLSGRADVIYVDCSPATLGLVAYIYKLVYKARVILNVEDLWPDAVAASGMASSPVYSRAASWIASLTYRLATIINVHTTGFMSALTERGIAEKNITVTPIWADRDIFYQAERDEEFGKKYDLSEKICIIHAGNIGSMQNLGNILGAAALLRDVEELRFVFVGSGNEMEQLMQEAEALQLTNVIFTGYYPITKMSGVLAWGSALLVSLRAGRYLSINFPSKISGYTAVGRPVLACADGEASDIVEHFGIGFSCAPDDPAAVASMVRLFLETPERERLEMGIKSRQVFEQYYDKDTIVKKYIELFESI